MQGNRILRCQPAALLGRAMLWLFTVLALAEAPLGELFGNSERRGGALLRDVGGQTVQYRPVVQVSEGRLESIENGSDPLRSAQALDTHKDSGEDQGALQLPDPVFRTPRLGRGQFPPLQPSAPIFAGLGARAPPSFA